MASADSADSAEWATIQTRAQALRDTRLRASVLNLLDPQAREWERTDALRRCLRWGTMFVVITWVLAGAFYITGSLSDSTSSPHSSDSHMTFVQMGVVIGGLLVSSGQALFPARYLAASADALLAALAPSASYTPSTSSTPSIPSTPLATRARRQPLAATLALGAEEALTLIKWNTDREAKALHNREMALAVLCALGLAMGALTGFSIYVFTSLAPAPAPIEQILVVGCTLLTLAFAGWGVWAAVEIWRAFWRAKRVRRELMVTVDAAGLTWTDDAWRGRGPMRLDWRDVRSFCVTTYRPAPDSEQWQVYMLDGGQTRLLWVLWPSAPAHLRATHDRLASLLVGATSQPLRDMTPGIVALGANIRATNPLEKSKAAQAFAAAQPIIPGAPIAAMRRWARVYQWVMVGFVSVFCFLTIVVFVNDIIIARL